MGSGEDGFADVAGVGDHGGQPGCDASGAELAAGGVEHVVRRV
ncbi:MAG: hypothetical protein QOG07_852 [Pseudonocardiales bacterium]|nr:hypothetical protein [Pseudonocardiales bacterium]